MYSTTEKVTINLISMPYLKLVKKKEFNSLIDFDVSRNRISSFVLR